MEFISARVSSGKDEGTGIEDGDWERADEGFVFKTLDAWSCRRRLVGIVAEVFTIHYMYRIWCLDN